MREIERPTFSDAQCTTTSLIRTRSASWQGLQVMSSSNGFSLALIENIDKSALCCD